MWQRAQAYLADARPIYESMDLDTLVADIDAVFARVPAVLYNEVVSPSVIDGLRLPNVRIQITDNQVASRVASWSGQVHPQE